MYSLVNLEIGFERIPSSTKSNNGDDEIVCLEHSLYSIFKHQIKYKDILNS